MPSKARYAKLVAPAHQLRMALARLRRLIEEYPSTRILEGASENGVLGIKGDIAFVRRALSEIDRRI